MSGTTPHDGFQYSRQFGGANSLSYSSCVAAVRIHIPHPCRSQMGHLIFCSRGEAVPARILHVDPTAAPLIVVAVEIRNAELIGIADHPFNKPVSRLEKRDKIALDVPLGAVLGATNPPHRSSTVN